MRHTLLFLLLAACGPATADIDEPKGDDDDDDSIGDDDDDDDDDDDPISVTGTVGPDGGVIEEGDVRLEIPQGALGGDVEITITETSDRPEDPYLPLSNIWLFEPAGLVFNTPVEVSIPFDGPHDPPRLFWSVEGDDSSWREVQGSTTLGGVMSGEVSHFSTGFVATLPVFTDTFEAEVGQADVLFVVDNSCSMAEEQAALADSFPAVMTAFVDSDIDFHVGVVSTDMFDPGHSGTLRQAMGHSWIDSSTPDPEDTFTAMAQMGTAGHYDEAGLDAAYTAIEAFGQTVNAGFVRDDANLAIVVLSDENDYSSVIAPGSFSGWLQSYKASPAMVSFHAIVGTTNPPTCAVEPSTRYIGVANTVGGVVSDICAADYVAPLVEMFDSFAVPQLYTLSTAPDASTLVVTVTDDSGTTDTLTIDDDYELVGQDLAFTGRTIVLGDTIEATYEPL